MVSKLIVSDFIKTIEKEYDLFCKELEQAETKKSLTNFSKKTEGLILHLVKVKPEILNTIRKVSDEMVKKFIEKIKQENINEN